MEAVTLEVVLISLNNRLSELKHPENCNQFVAEYNRLLEEAKKNFPKEEYVQASTPIEEVPSEKEGENLSQAQERLLEHLRMKVDLLRAYVSSEVAKERKKTSVY